MVRKQGCVTRNSNDCLLWDCKVKGEASLQLWYPVALVLLDLSESEGVKIDLFSVHMDALIYVLFSLLPRLHASCGLSLYTLLSCLCLVMM